jgi:hypothetical protein
MGIASAPLWPRDTPWRQGMVVRPEDAVRLGLLHEQSAQDTRVVVVSHHCDLANDNLEVEPDVEVIVGRDVAKVNGSYTHAKSPRTLHWEIWNNQALVTIELVATGKRRVRKADFAQSTPDPTFVVEPAQLQTLRYWLGIRYNRAAFSDSFEQRLKDTKLGEKLARLMDRSGQGISAIYFDVDAGKALDRSDGTPHTLGIVLTYPAVGEPEAAMDTAEAIALQVEALFVKACFNETTESWRHIHLKACIAIAEEDITVAKAKQMTLWRLEHLSLRDDGDDPVPWGLQG